MRYLSRRKKRLLVIILAAIALALAPAVWNLFLHGNPSDSVILPGTPSASLAGQSAAVHVVDVGQGDAILLEQGGKYALIDTGTPASADALTFYLDAHGVHRLDYLILSHFHTDHIGGAYDILHNFPVAHVLLPDLSLAPAPTGSTALQLLEELADRSDKGKIRVSVPTVGNTYTLGEALITVIGTGIPDAEDANNTSLAVLFTFDNFTFFSAGDAEAEAEAALLAHNRTLHADLYKASHHGSSTSSTKALLDAMQPKMAAVSCGAGNDYGHPHWEVLQRFETAGIRYRRTDVNGSLLFTAKDGVLTAYCEKRG